MAKPLLSISTLAPERARVNIDGIEYELKHRSELGLRKLVQLEALMAQYGKLIDFTAQGGEATDEEFGALETAMDKLLRIFLDAPDEVQNRLSSQNRYAIMVAFAEASKANAQPPAPMNRANRRTSAKSSPRSSASTAASRKPGSTSRSLSSARSVA